MSKRALKNWIETNPLECEALSYKGKESALPYEITLLSNLKTLILQMEKLEQIPLWFGELENLTSLTLNTPELKNLEHLFSLRSLKHLHIKSLKQPQVNLINHCSNQLLSLSLNNLELEDLPLGVENFPLLENLYLMGNKIQSVSPRLFQMPNLKRLYLNNNQIKDVSDQLFSSGLQLISLDGNPLTEEKRDSIYNKYKIWIEIS